MSIRSRMTGAALAASVVLGVSWAAPAGAFGGVVVSRGPLTDLATSAANATDGARGRFVAYPDDGGTTAILIVTGLDESAEGTTYGAHVHTGPCVEGQPATAGPHFNIGGPVDPEHEIWLDFTVLPGGVGYATAWVPFVIDEGAANSVVIHALPTAPSGDAGGRQACLPAEF